MADYNRIPGGNQPVGRRVALIGLVLSLLMLASPVSAGTPGPAYADPVPVADLHENDNDASPMDLVAIGSTVFFTAEDGLAGREIFRTSPPYNSIQQVTDICAGGCSANPSFLTVLGNTLFFNATDGINGSELWRSEPPYTPASTYRVADINPNGGSGPEELTPIGNAVFFTADDGQHGRELWRSSPPYHDAVLIRDIFPGGAGSAPHDLTRIGWMLFFAADDSTGSEIWRSDPPYSVASTFQVTDINPEGSANILELTPLDLKLFFSATDGSTGQELYLIESPYLQTRRVTDVAGNASSSNPRNLVAVGDTLLFSANILFSGRELYKSQPPYEPTSTTLVEDIDPGFSSSFPDRKFVYGATVFFSAHDGVHGWELWRTQPGYLPSTTEMVMDINEGPGSSNPRAMIMVGTTLFFNANDGVYGPELWQSTPPYDDSTTTIVYDLYRGVTGSNPHSVLVNTNTLFFAATDESLGEELYRYGGFFGIPNTGFAPGRVSAVPRQPVEKAYQGMDELWLEIPRLGVKMPVVGVPASPAGWDLSWLTTQAGYLTGTAYPTWAGNTVLTGHVYLSDGSPGPFAGISRLRHADRIILKAYGQTYLYEVRSNKVILPDDAGAVFAHEDLNWLTLVTCQNYDEQTDSYLNRVVVRAVLVKVESQ